MADKLLFRGGGTANIASSTVADREIVIDTDTNEIVVNSDKVRTLMQSSGGDVAVTGHVAIGQAVVADNIFRSTSDGVYNIVAKSAQPSPTGLGTDHNWTGLDASDTVTSIITRDGTIKLGGVTNTAPNIELNNAGSITAKGGTSFTAANSGSAQTVLSRWTSDHYTTNSTVLTINGDGSISTAGDIKHTAFDSSSNAATAKGITAYSSGQLIIQGSSGVTSGSQTSLAVYFGNSEKFSVKNDGSITASNITAFKNSLTTAMGNTSITTVADLKSAINTALALL